MSKFLMISFDDERMKSISEILGNKTCQKILNFLAERNASETDISRELGMPLNTVGYNVKKLLYSGLIEKAEHFWSIKGKKMPVYKVSNKSIVISPKNKNNLNSLIPAVLLTGAAAFFIRTFSLQEVSLKSGADNAILAAETGAVQSMNAGLSFLDKILAIPAWSWFLIGAGFALIVYFLTRLIAERRRV